MIIDVTITILPEEEKNSELIRKLCFIELDKKDISFNKDEVSLVFVKKSIDARHGQLKLHLRYKVYINESPANTKEDQLPSWKKVCNDKKVIIVGSGPAGLFGALKLLENGIKPIIVERGKETENRKKDIAKISTEGIVNANSNYCFGEGGAGTFSDGKLYTRSNKRGNINRILQIFTNFGADSSILTDAHPHIGTEKLPTVINSIKDFIKNMGGEFLFNSQCIDFVKKESEVTGIIIEDVITKEKKELYADSIVIATGHSATDIYKLIAKHNKNALEAKIFAMGVRVEHPRVLIDSIQYHGKTEGMGAAEYKLTTQVENRGVYSFCMCPGGFVVPSQSADDEIVVNGMSASRRNSIWSNSAIVVETRPEDIPEEFCEKANNEGCKALAGLFFRQSIEKETKKAGKGQMAPAQLMTDFLANKESNTLPKSSYTPGLVPSRLDIWLPEQISGRLSQAFHDFGKNMKGFVCKDAVLIASETRTSTPVRILRNETTLECPDLLNLYPAGEGSGYAGGIVSSAMDGEKVCEIICHKLLKRI